MAKKPNTAPQPEGEIRIANLADALGELTATHKRLAATHAELTLAHAQLTERARHDAMTGRICP